jgi:hypothetical protein
MFIVSTLVQKEHCKDSWSGSPEADQQAVLTLNLLKKKTWRTLEHFKEALIGRYKLVQDISGNRFSGPF